jgi:hypothetical protein
MFRCGGEVQPGHFPRSCSDVFMVAAEGIHGIVRVASPHVVGFEVSRGIHQ